ncbi:MAG: YIP1 family protein [Parachlamydia sp.]|nr:YIP1 family protein [Parachlamydia sp.]
MVIPILTINPGALLALWLWPRATAYQLLEKKKRYTHLNILITLAFVYFGQGLAFLWIGNLLPDSSRLSLAAPFWFFVFLVAGIVVILNLGALVFYYLIKSFGGQGSFAQTKTIVYWSSLCTIPVGLFFLSFIWSGLMGAQAAEKGIKEFLFTDILQLVSVLGMFAFSIYGMIVLTKMLSEIHQIRAGKAFAAVAGGIFATCFLAPLILMAAIKSFVQA